MEPKFRSHFWAQLRLFSHTGSQIWLSQLLVASKTNKPLSRFQSKSCVSLPPKLEQQAARRQSVNLFGTGTFSNCTSCFSTLRNLQAFLNCLSVLAGVSSIPPIFILSFIASPSFGSCSSTFFRSLSSFSSCRCCSRFAPGLGACANSSISLSISCCNSLFF